MNTPKRRIEKRRVRFRAEVTLKAFTYRRTPKDVDGYRWDVPCTVGLPWVLRGTPPKKERNWFNVRFADGKIDQRRRDRLFLFEAEHYPRYPITVHKAAKDTSLGFWWVNAGGTAERPATSYEIARAFYGDAPPHEGWHLLDGVSVVAVRKALPIGAAIAPSEVEAIDQRFRKEALQKRREAALVHAEAMLKKHERAAKRHAKLSSKWRAVVKRRRNALEES